MWFYLKSELKKLNKSIPTDGMTNKKLSTILEDTNDHKR